MESLSQFFPAVDIEMLQEPDLGSAFFLFIMSLLEWDPLLCNSSAIVFWKWTACYAVTKILA